MSGEEKTCEFGCVYKANMESQHQDSISCCYLYLNDLKRRKIQTDFIDHHQKRTINVLISNAKQSIQGELECGKCDFTGNLQEVIRHEKECIGFKNEIDFNEKKLYSDKKVTCKHCGKVFLHTCLTSEPKHQLNRHAKTCEKTLSRRFRASITEFIKDVNDPYILREIDELCKKHKEKM